MSGRSKILTWGLPIAGGAALLAGTGMVVENRPVRADEVPPRQPTTAPTLTADVDASRYIGAIGVSEPAGEAIAIAAHRKGIVASVDIGVGDEVVRGQPLFTVDAREALAAVELRRAEVGVAEAEVASLRAGIPPRRATLRSAEAALASARAGVEAARADRDDRANQLSVARSVSDPRAIASEEVDRRRFALQQAEARLLTAEALVAEAEARVAEADAELARLVNPEDGRDGPDIAAAVARVTQAERALRTAETDVELLTVASPIDGRVLQVNIRPGEFAPEAVPSEGLVVLGRPGAAHLRVEIDEVDIPRFRADARAWASPRGDATLRVPLSTVLVEPLVVPKANLSGSTRELVDTRVLQVVYRLDGKQAPVTIGQQFDVYIEAPELGS